MLLDVAGDGLLADGELAGDRAVGFAGRDEPQHLQLARREPARAGGRRLRREALRRAPRSGRGAEPSKDAAAASSSSCAPSSSPSWRQASPISRGRCARFVRRVELAPDRPAPCAAPSSAPARRRLRRAATAPVACDDRARRSGAYRCRPQSPPARRRRGAPPAMSSHASRISMAAASSCDRAVAGRVVSCDATRRIAASAASMLALRETEQRQARMRFAPGLAGASGRPPPPRRSRRAAGAARPAGRARRRRRCGRSGEPVARALRLVEGVRPGAVHLQDLGSVDEALAADTAPGRGWDAHQPSSAPVHSCARRRSKSS